ncbi:GGDEF domain-containing protein [Amedibacillus sp. YH-ame6]
MTIYEQYSAQYNKRWQERIVKTNFVTASVVLIFEIAYYFILTKIGLRNQTSLEYILQYILLPASIIFSSCIMGWFVVYRSNQSSEVKSLAAILTTVALCTAAASVHNIFATTLCSFFIPLSISVVFGSPRITNAVGSFCLLGELIAMCFANMDLRGNDPYFLLDCLMLFIVFGISWYATLLLMKNEQEKRHVIDRMREEQSMLEQKICNDELTGLYNMLGLQLFAEAIINEKSERYLDSTLAFLDIDNFKLVNDTYGHEAGNIALIYIANFLKNHCPKNACVSRYGGDEYIILLPNVSIIECEILMNNMLSKLATSSIEELNEMTLSLSCGVSTYDFCTPVLNAIKNSDHAMYQAKNTGKNRCVVL